ncbi:GH36 C-terminal domain-containing protein, partial [Streptomyces sp. NPDC005322]|uniref:GH36 C-terminal domain-containing protein n=1 Tax=Streptomyces sp. NPDC005322 TaxID=3157032 RepID=UPI0033B33791
VRFRFAGAMAGVLGLGGDPTRWSEAERAEARDWVAIHKRVRPVVRHGELYRLWPPDGDGLSAVRFRFAGAMAGVLGLGGDPTRWSEAERAEARDWVAIHKRVRPVVRHGELYRLWPPDGDGLSAVQYVRGEETGVLTWPHAQHYGEQEPPLRLRGLDPRATYEGPATGEVHRRAVLSHRGLRTGLSGDLDAAVFRLRKTDQVG